MSQIILDAGSGNTCKNDKKYVKRMIDELSAIDTRKHEVIIKWQLFKEAGDNIPLTHDVFDYAYYYADEKGYKTTSSVFDKDSLDFLLQYDVPFIKIANNRKLDWLIGEIPRRVSVYVSNSDKGDINMCCISKYPSTIFDYDRFTRKAMSKAISDHTTNWAMFKTYNPEIYECHYKLDDSVGLDAGDFARMPTQLKEIL